MRKPPAKTSIFLDQAVYSAASLLAVLSVSRNFSPADFGAFMLAYAASMLLLSTSRQYFGVELARTSNEPPSIHDQRFRRYWTTLAVLAPAAFGFTAITSSVGDTVTGTGRLLSMTVALSTPFLLSHDLMRYFQARRAPGVVLIADAVRLFGLASCLILGPSMATWSFCALWFLCHASSWAVSLVGLKGAVLSRDWAESGSKEWGIREAVTATGLLSAAVPLVTGWIVSLSISTSALGAWRGATTLFGPLNTLITLLDFAILGRYVALEQGERYRYLRRLGLAYAGIAAGWGLLLALVPDTVGGLLLGPSWPDATRLLPIAAVEYVFLCAVAVVLLEFKASQWARRITINKLLTSGIIVGVSLTVALTLPSIEFIALASVAGAVAGFALAVSAVLTTSRRP